MRHRSGSCLIDRVFSRCATPTSLLSTAVLIYISVLLPPICPVCTLESNLDQSNEQARCVTPQRLLPRSGLQQQHR